MARAMFLLSRGGGGIGKGGHVSSFEGGGSIDTHTGGPLIRVLVKNQKNSLCMHFLACAIGVNVVETHAWYLLHLCGGCGAHVSQLLQVFHAFNCIAKPCRTMCIVPSLLVRCTALKNTPHQAIGVALSLGSKLPPSSHVQITLGHGVVVAKRHPLSIPGYKAFLPYCLCVFTTLLFAYKYSSWLFTLGLSCYASSVRKGAKSRCAKGSDEKRPPVGRGATSNSRSRCCGVGCRGA